MNLKIVFGSHMSIEIIRVIVDAITLFLVYESQSLQAAVIASINI